MTDALVLIQGMRVGNLYVLSRNTVICGATMSSSNDHDSFSTCLWHLCMGHMSECGLTKLSEQDLLCGTKQVRLL